MPDLTPEKLAEWKALAENPPVKKFYISRYFTKLDVFDVGISGCNIMPIPLFEKSEQKAEYIADALEAFPVLTAEVSRLREQLQLYQGAPNLTAEQVKALRATVEANSYLPSEFAALCADWFTLQAQLAEAQAELAELKADNLRLSNVAWMDRRDRDAVQSQVEALKQERDAARKALNAVRQNFVALSDSIKTVIGDNALIVEEAREYSRRAALQSQAQPAAFHRCPVCGSAMYEVRPDEWGCHVCEGKE